MVRAQWIPWGHNIHIFQAVLSLVMLLLPLLPCLLPAAQALSVLWIGAVLHCEHYTALWTLHYTVNTTLHCTTALHYIENNTLNCTTTALNYCTVNTTLYSNRNTKLENLALSQTVFLQFTFCTKHIFLKHLLLSSVAIFIHNTDLIIIQCLKLNNFSVFPPFY